MSIIDQSLKLLGINVKDVVTGFEGVCVSVTFDAYGCVQTFVSPPVAADGKLADGHWFDVKRLVLNGERVLPAPNFSQTKFGEENGSNALPRLPSMPAPRS